MTVNPQARSDEGRRGQDKRMGAADEHRRMVRARRTRILGGCQQPDVRTPLFRPDAARSPNS
jgi:hypothetical protein